MATPDTAMDALPATPAASTPAQPRAPGQGQASKLATRHLEVLRMSKETVIKTMKPRLIKTLADLIAREEERQAFLLLTSRIDSVVRAWFRQQFEEINQLYSLFDPADGPKNVKRQNLAAAQLDVFEQAFLKDLFQVLMKSNFKMLTDAEYKVAKEGQYLLSLDVDVDMNKLDGKLLSTYFENNPSQDLPFFAKKYVVFRRGVGIDRTTDLFLLEKVNMLLAAVWNGVLTTLRLKKGEPPGNKVIELDSLAATKKTDAIVPDVTSTVHAQGGVAQDQDEMFVERIRIQNMKLTLENFTAKHTIQEPTFDRMIVLYRTAVAPSADPAEGRGIHIKHFRHVPMADMEIVLPEKKSPGLTPIDTIKLAVTALGGLTALFGSFELKLNFNVMLAVLGAVVGYLMKVYFTFATSIRIYQELIMKAVYDKQLDSGKGTLLHLCNDVVEQEVKEVIVAYFVLMSQGSATEAELDRRCEGLLEGEFNETCNFEVRDAITKLERLNIVSKDPSGVYVHHPLKQANDLIGVTTDEVVSHMLS
eukprot:SM000063S19998  [mRNA]  locus=s63:245444:250363:+ [translate_table: standard]